MLDIIFCGSRMYCVLKFWVCALALAVSGCSPHPLLSDVAPLSVSALSHKIQCEAADFVKSIHPANGAGQQYSDYKLKSKEIEKDAADVKEQAAKLPLGVDGTDLASALYAIKLKASQLKPVLMEVRKGLEANPNDEGLKAKLETLDLEASELGSQFTKINSDIQLLAKVDKLSKKLAAKSEARDKDYGSIIKFEKQLAAFQLVLEITEDNDASTTGSLKWPIALGAFSLGWEAGEKKQRLSDRKVSMVLTFAELSQLPCGNVARHGSALSELRYPITGTIGLAEVISEYVSISARGTGRFEDGGKSYSDKIRFTTTVNGKLKPSVDISRQVGQIISANADVSLGRKDVHELTILLSAPVPTVSDKPHGPQEIIIRRMPTAEALVMRLPP